ncbi:hypothetical protein FBEOM_505 [Fusarium beomiforme]|uniref:Uncharacterized protein n=1 Tax=Fusarium beomiforme TaxID=44412 RepID=A0A9P5AV34_9HYPO|nr:hypothetical protein FBEOM_505 [Fusarium beomiforme]
MTFNSPSSKLVELSQLLRQNPGPGEYLIEGTMLMHVEDPESLLPKTRAVLGPSQRDLYIRSVARPFCSKEADRSIEEAAKLTCQNASAINFAFMGVTLAFVMSDGQRGTHNADRMVPIVRTYAKFLLDSIQLAKDIAHYGEDFDDNVVAQCADPNVPINERKLILEKYIEHAEGLEEMSKNVLNRLNSLRNDFFDLIQDVRRSNGSSESTSTIKEVDQLDVAGLNVDLGHPILKLAFDLPGSLPPFLAIGGLMALKREKVAEEILFLTTFHAQRTAKQQTVYGQDQKLGGDALQLLTSFDKNFTKMGQSWFHSLVDAREIEKWLQDGADMAAWPKYVRDNMEHGVKLYQAMAKYLRGYAKGIADMHVERWHVLDPLTLLFDSFLTTLHLQHLIHTMETALPQYSAQGAPSYEDVVKKFTAALGDGKDPEKILDAADALNMADCKAIFDKTGGNPVPFVDEKDREKFHLGAEQAASLPLAQKHLKETAKTATQAVKDIEGIFGRLLLKIMEIDQIHESDFIPELRKHKETFTDLIRESRLLAREISQYGQQFDEVTVKFCADKDISVADRIKRIQRFIEKTKGFETASGAMEKRFTKLNEDFTVFVGKFVSWAKKKEGELDEKVTQLIKEIGELKGGGLILAGLSAAACIGLIATWMVLSNELEQKENQKKQYEDQINQIQKARSELVSLGKDELAIFSEKINFLKGYWTKASSDAVEIERWLQDGADDAKFPKYMEKNLKKGVEVSLSTYLDEYSRGVDSEE